MPAVVVGGAKERRERLTDAERRRRFIVGDNDQSETLILVMGVSVDVIHVSGFRGTVAAEFYPVRYSIARATEENSKPPKLPNLGAQMLRLVPVVTRTDHMLMLNGVPRSKSLKCKMKIF